MLSLFCRKIRAPEQSVAKEKTPQHNIRWYEIRFNEIFLIFVRAKKRDEKRVSETNEEKSFIGILFQFNIDTPLIIHDTLPGPYHHHNLFIFGKFDTDLIQIQIRREATKCVKVICWVLFQLPSLTRGQKNIDDFENLIWIFTHLYRNWVMDDACRCRKTGTLFLVCRCCSCCCSFILHTHSIHWLISRICYSYV